MLADASIGVQTLAALLRTQLCDALLANEDRFNALDRAIGDGDHGNNMSRAARAVAAMADELDEACACDALTRAGKTVIMSIGGASGPLYGSLLLEMGKALPASPCAEDWARAFCAGVAAVGQRGRSAEGDKTMLDVLAPAARAFAAAADRDPAEVLTAMVAAARQGSIRARALKAARGRAAYVGDRSIGQDDPGAASALLCIETVGSVFMEYMG